MRLDQHVHVIAGRRKERNSGRSDYQLVASQSFVLRPNNPRCRADTGQGRCPLGDCEKSAMQGALQCLIFKKAGQLKGNTSTIVSTGERQLDGLPRGRAQCAAARNTTVDAQGEHPELYNSSVSLHMDHGKLTYGSSDVQTAVGKVHAPAVVQLVNILEAHFRGHFGGCRGAHDRLLPGQPLQRRLVRMIGQAL